jgi:GNAT superfamily N-acetyltransferase
MSGAIVLRDYRPADSADLTRVRTSVQHNHMSLEMMAAVGITPQGINDDIMAGVLRCYVAEAEGCVRGFSLAHRDHAEIFGLFVEPGFEGRGFGSALLAAVEGWLKEIGHARAVLNTGRGTPSQGFYERRGWVKTAEVNPLFPDDETFRKRL